MMMLNRDFCIQKDQGDPLACLRDDFGVPDGIIYLDGNSLGAMPSAAMERAKDVIEREWGSDLIRSWNSAGWFDAPYRLGDKLARILGAEEGEIIVSDTVSINLFKVVAAALALRPDRKVIVMEASNFPTDNYMVQGLIEFIGQDHEIRFCEKDGIYDAIDETVALVCLTDVHFKYGHVLDMKRITRHAHDVGALAVWDLCHSAGAIPVNLNGANADFAIGCCYKYLNGGPGAPAFLFVAKRHQDKTRQPLTGWWGHRAPFAFDRDYHRGGGIQQFLTSTQPILSLSVAEVGIDMFLDVDMQKVREKSQALTELFITLVEQKCSKFGFQLVSPRNPDERGSQVSFSHDNGYAIMKALIARGVIGDFRAPDVVRFGFAPLYIRYVDVWDAVETLQDIMKSKEWTKPEYSVSDAVT